MRLFDKLFGKRDNTPTSAPTPKEDLDNVDPDIVPESILDQFVLNSKEFYYHSAKGQELLFAWKDKQFNISKERIEYVRPIVVAFLWLRQLAIENREIYISIINHYGSDTYPDTIPMRNFLWSYFRIYSPTEVEQIKQIYRRASGIVSFLDMVSNFCEDIMPKDSAPFGSIDPLNSYDDKSDSAKNNLGETLSNRPKYPISTTSPTKPRIIRKTSEGFGYEDTNPIIVNRNEDETSYLQRLRLPNGEPIKWKFKSVIYGDSNSPMISIYKFFTQDDKELGLLHFVKEDAETRSELPSGLFFEEQLSDLSLDGICRLYLFIATWCGPSERLHKELNEAGFDLYELIDVDEKEDMALKYRTTSVPTMILEDSKGTIIRRWVGHDDCDPGQSHIINYINALNLSINEKTPEKEG